MTTYSRFLARLMVAAINNKRLYSALLWVWNKSPRRWLVEA